MTLLHTLRNAPWLARLALLWFALTLGVAGASPMVQPQTLTLCTSTGMLKVLLSDDGTLTTAVADTGSALFCPLCLVGGAPSPVVLNKLAAPQALSQLPQSIPMATVAALMAAPPPARAPPKA